VISLIMEGVMDLTDAARQVLASISPLVATGALAKIGQEATDTSTELLGRAWDTLTRRFEGHKKAEAALTLYEDEPLNPALQQQVEQRIIEVFGQEPTAAQELLDLAQAVAALNPESRTGAPGSFPERPAVPALPELPATLSADGVSFSYGYALIIGVGNYKQPDLNVPGHTTANDARALAALLRDPELSAYPDDQVRVLVDARATKTNILDELESLAKRAYGGAALIFFAGRGEPVENSYALLPYDIDLKDLAGTGITAELFQQRLAKVRENTKQLVVLLNCCHAAGFGNAGMGVLSGDSPSADFYKPLVVGSGQAVISSSRPSQKSSPRSQINSRYTPFGTQLLAGLRGQAPGNEAGIGVFDLFAHLRARVPADAEHMRYNNTPLVQEPLLYVSQLDDNIPIALRPGWQGGTPGDDTLNLSRRLAELELAADAGELTPQQISERDALLKQITA
jgi:hypothetical protein